MLYWTRERHKERGRGEISKPWLEEHSKATLFCSETEKWNQRKTSPSRSQIIGQLTVNIKRDSNLPLSINIDRLKWVHGHKQKGQVGETFGQEVLVRRKVISSRPSKKTRPKDWIWTYGRQIGWKDIWEGEKSCKNLFERVLKSPTLLS